MQAALADQRAAEAAIEKQRAFHDEQSERVSRGAGPLLRGRRRHLARWSRRSNTRASCASASATTWRRRTPRSPISPAHIERDERAARRSCARRLHRLAPELERRAARRERAPPRRWRRAEQALQDWQQRWEEFNRALGAADQTTQVERARIEQLENQLRRLHGAGAIASRWSATRCAAQESGEQLAQLDRARKRGARTRSDELTAGTRAPPSSSVQTLRAEQLAAEKRAGGGARRARARPRRADLARGPAEGRAERRRRRARPSGCAARASARSRAWRETLEVEAGWERAVETVLGDYLEAVCVDGLDASPAALASSAKGRVTLLGRRRPRCGAARAGGTLAAQGAAGRRGPSRSSVGVLTAESLADGAAGARARCRRRVDHHPRRRVGRAGLAAGQPRRRSSRRRHRARASPEGAARRRSRVAEERRAAKSRRSLAARAVAARRGGATAITRSRASRRAHRTHAELLGQLEGEPRRARRNRTLRRERLRAKRPPMSRREQAAHRRRRCARARAELRSRRCDCSRELDSRRAELEAEREERRDAVSARALAGAGAADARARSARSAIESRRSTESSVARRHRAA